MLNLKEFILNHSNSYNYYKNGYLKYKQLNERESSFKNQVKYEEINKNLSELNYKQEKYDNKLAKLEKEINDDKTYLKSDDNNFDKDREIKETIKNQREIRLKENEIKNLKSKITTLEHKLEISENSLKTMEKEHDKRMNDKINSIQQKKSYIDFSEYLKESYNFPFIRPPFSEENREVFAMMEEVATYLINKTEQINEKPLISVIMPVYNRKDVVMNAINSVLNQTYENFELIVVDDASTDGTTELLKQINHEKVRVIFHEKNKYASGARNTGLKNAKGEYVAYLDSDNLFDERYLAATVGAFLELPDAYAIYSAQYRYETYEDKPFAVQFGVFNKSLIHNHNYVDMNCFAHRRITYEKIGGFDETLKGADDWDLILKISNNFKVYSVPFLLSKCYLGVVDNRVTDLIPTDIKKIRAQNEVLPKSNKELKKPVTIIIPIYKSSHNLRKCLDSIINLKLKNIKVIIVSSGENIEYLENIYDKEIDIKIINEENINFTNSILVGLKYYDNESDLLLLDQEAILTEGSLEELQYYANTMSDAGLIIPQQIIPNGSLIKQHVPYAHDDYWMDITPSKFYRNIINVPIFHNGELLELNFAPFFCTYLSKEVYERTNGFNNTLGKHLFSMKLLSNFIRHVLNLKIYHVSSSLIIRNINEKEKNSVILNEYGYTHPKNMKEIKNEDKYTWDF